jgi:hypothetical protein
MTQAAEILPSWRPGPARESIVAFLEQVESVPVVDRFACFDNDGTLWCERPNFIQFDFLIDALKSRVAADASVAEVPEFAALLSGDSTALAELGLTRIAFALTGLFEGLSPTAFEVAAREFLSRATHAELGRPAMSIVYQPMLELLDELRRRDFTIALVTGGGTEFVRAFSNDLYGVPPELVVGTLIKYEFSRDDDDRPVLRRTNSLEGDPNEGAAKVANIQTQIGRRPILVGGNSGGDREMLEWGCAGDLPGLAILIDHDDAEREYEYVSTAQTFVEAEPITVVGARLGWTVVSMANDWKTVFPHVS